MSSEWTAVDNEGATIDLENLSTQRWLEGQLIGAAAVAGWLRRAAAKSFEEGDDAKAVLLRDLGNRIPAEVAKQIDEQAQRHAKEHPFRAQPPKEGT